MDKPSRFEEIDVLRGIAVFAMILIHVNYFYISQKIPFILWNYSQFAVPVFIFCSSYLFFVKSSSLSLNYLKKRFSRLLIPYWIFLSLFIPLVYLNEPGKVSINYVLSSILGIGGVDISWLVLLFLIFTILFPLIKSLEKNKILFFAFSLISFIVSLVLVFFSFPLNYKFIMWVPWSLVILFSIFFIKFEAKKWFFPSIIIVSFVLYLVLGFVLANLNHNLSFVNNKYPPNLYLLSFGFFAITLLFWLAKLKVFKPLSSGISFLSLNSYNIYFIHYFILYFVRIFAKNLPWYGIFLLVLASSVLVQIFINEVSVAKKTLLIKTFKKF